MTVAILRCAIAAVAIAVAAPAAALEADKTQAVTLEADDFEFDLDSGARIYRGNVVYRQGSIRVECDALTTRHDGDGELQSGVCTGNPGRFRQTLAGDDGETTVVQGQARAITFDRGRIVLDGDAQVAHAGDRLSGARIAYDVDARKAKVTGDGDGSGRRPRIEIAPRPGRSN